MNKYEHQILTNRQTINYEKNVINDCLAVLTVGVLLGLFEKGNEECRMIYLPIATEQGHGILNTDKLVRYLQERE